FRYVVDDFSFSCFEQVNKVHRWSHSSVNAFYAKDCVGELPTGDHGEPHKVTEEPMHAGFQHLPSPLVPWKWKQRRIVNGVCTFRSRTPLPVRIETPRLAVVKNSAKGCTPNLCFISFQETCSLAPRCTECASRAVRREE